MLNQENGFNKYALPFGVVLLVVLAVGGWYLYQSSRNSAAEVEQVVNEQFAWRLTTEDTPQGKQTTVVLRIADVDVPVGIVAGTCSEIDGTQWQLLENELSGVICQSADAGVEIGVFQNGNDLIMKKGEVHGTERTNFVQITNAQ